jgi:isopenicillin N synthase-like dioxygenase
LSKELNIPLPPTSTSKEGHSDESSDGCYFDYFEKELNFIGNGQLHIKRCRNNENDAGNHVRLLAHTDPSLITMVVHDREGVGHDAMGLEIHHKVRKSYEPLLAGGWGVVTVFAGDVLSRVCGSDTAIHAPLHRVVSTDEVKQGGGGLLLFIFIHIYVLLFSSISLNFPLLTPQNQRVAATFFIQPSLQAPLNLVPKMGQQNQNHQTKANPTYGAWKEQKYNKYFKKS